MQLNFHERNRPTDDALLCWRVSTVNTKSLLKGIQRHTTEWERALTAENSCKLAGCRQRGLEMKNEKRERSRKIHKSCNCCFSWGSNMKYEWSSLKAAVNHLWDPKASQPFNNHYWLCLGWSTHRACLFLGDKIKSAVLDVALLMRSSNPAQGLVYVVKSTLTWHTLLNQHIIGLKSKKEGFTCIYSYGVCEHSLVLTAVYTGSF